MAIGFNGSKVHIHGYDRKSNWKYNLYEINWTVGGVYASGPGITLGNDIKNDPDLVILKGLNHFCQKTGDEIVEGDIIENNNGFRRVAKLDAKTFYMLEEDRCIVVGHVLVDGDIKNEEV